MCLAPGSYISRCLWVGIISVLGCALQVNADQPAPLTNDSVIQMIRWRISEPEIVSTIERNDTNFDLTPESLAFLKAAGVTDTILDAMWKATIKSSKNAIPLSRTMSSPPTTSAAAEPPKVTRPVPAHSDDRFSVARNVKAETAVVNPYNPACPLTNDGSEPKSHIQLDWDSTSISPSHLDRSGATCFELHTFNDILYAADFTFTETVPTESAFDLLKDAISAVTGLLSAGSQNQKNQTPNTNVTNGGAACPVQLPNDVNAAIGTAGALQGNLSLLDPGKDSSGKINLVPLATTLSKWQLIPREYEGFQTAVSNVVRDLNMNGAEACKSDLLASAETIIVDAYLPMRNAFTVLASHAQSAHIVRFTGDIEITSNYVLEVKAKYPAGEVSNGTKTFSLSAGRKILSSSGGFLITELPARSYSSVTSPTGMVTAPTQNVLGVDFRSGPRPALTALLNFYLPNLPVGSGRVLPLNGRTYGLALSTGPVFDVTNGKADTSRLGFFGGVSLHLWNQFFITPGVHIGEFADFPQGYVSAGQVIPPNSGTPQGVKRYTARFAFALTYKIKDFGQTATKSNLDSANSNGGAQTPPKGSGSHAPQ